VGAPSFAGVTKGGIVVSLHRGILPPFEVNDP
jgi:hypothetical protein